MTDPKLNVGIVGLGERNAIHNLLTPISKDGLTMIPRHLVPHLLSAAREYPVLGLVGPRQSGKTTLARALFPQHRYLSLENLDLRSHAQEDPRGFLNDYGSGLILDEVQRVPEIFSYLQELVDQDASPGQYILIGSSQFLLMEGISQSLAGRIATFHLYPLSYLEWLELPQEATTGRIYRERHPSHPKQSSDALYDLLWSGLYPRIHDKKIESYRWLENYITTYLERDVRALINVRDLRTFENFLRLIAAQSGQLLNYTSLANAVGVSQPTIRQWTSLLETSGLIVILPPYFNNFSKRIVKTPKIYFVDTGLLCCLLSIRHVNQLKTHPLLGEIFETFIVGECFKRYSNSGILRPPLYFWRDQTGNEVDLLIHEGVEAFPIEIKLSQSYHSDFQRGVQKWLDLEGNPAKKGRILYGGEHATHLQQPIDVIPWWQV